MAEADLNVLWDTNPVSTQVNVMIHVTRARKERGAKLVVIDPYWTGSAAAVDMQSYEARQYGVRSAISWIVERRRRPEQVSTRLRCGKGSVADGPRRVRLQQSREGLHQPQHGSRR